ncbi:MAG: tRNA (guanine(46)-N(7))-methyltransferase TrmB [Myxococcaceae bacterium]
MGRPPLLPTPVGKDLVGLTEPPSWDQVFGFSGPLELEIGSGTGGHALEYTRRYPHIRFVAFEWRKKYARDTQDRADRRGQKNLRVIEADARIEVPHLFKPGSLSAIHLQFPDPWWKRAHQKRAVLSPEFTRLLWDLLVPDGLFDMRTDVEDRAQAMLATLEEAGFVNPLGRGVFHPYDPEEVPSTRERRYLASSEPVYRARLRKQTATASTALGH